MNKKIVIVVVISLTIISGLCVIAYRPVVAQERGNDEIVAQKLDEVVNNQKTILQEIGALKEELRIIKVRITQQQ